ncbi:MAG: hypothetical protein CM15mP113_0930 [Pseudomonadota bacterium]|nr:MAG: hypothetical protein CM15mP113_0930 [Pseudomonadota bacterium]
MNYLPQTLPEYSRDFSNELPIESFLQYGFYKIAEAGLKPEERFIKNPEVNPIQYNVVKGLEDKYNSYRELIYAIVIDGKNSQNRWYICWNERETRFLQLRNT